MKTSFFPIILFFIFSFFIVHSPANADWIDLPGVDSEVKAGTLLITGAGSISDKFSDRAHTGVRGPISKWHYYWENGFRIDTFNKNLTFKANLSIIIDGGYMGADAELETAFSDLEGFDIEFRDLRMTMDGTLYDWVEFRLSIEFANLRDIKDEWIRFKKIPFIRHFKIGYFKEPFSLENLTSLKSITFMETALPASAFGPGRNFGISRQTAALNQRMTWALGTFLNTDSFSDVGNSKDQIDNANGWNITGRVTGLPWYENKGEKLLHLGLSYSHQFRGREDFSIQLRTRPESRLSDDRLVDTGEFFIDGGDLINPEFAFISGPLSVQGEYFHVFADADVLDNPDFWGFYLYGSYFITGEHRSYNKRSGTFFSVKPKHNFHPRKREWGAWELASRISYIDLNGAKIRGGEEFNFTAGLNWYFNKKTRLMINYIHARVKDRETPPQVDSSYTDILQARLQIGF